MTKQYNRILAAVDGSSISRTVFRKALELADISKGTVDLVSVIDDGTFYGGLGNNPEYLSELTTTVQDQLDALTRELQPEFPDVKVGTMVVMGSPRKAIGIDLPTEWHSDLIVVGRTGLTKMQRFLLGSVSAAIIRNAVTDVLVVAPDEKEHE